MRMKPIDRVDFIRFTKFPINSCMSIEAVSGTRCTSTGDGIGVEHNAKVLRHTRFKRESERHSYPD